MKPVTLIPEIDNALSYWSKGSRTLSSFYALVLPIVRKFGGKCVGTGSSRRVYSLGNGRVLKVRYKGCTLCGYTQNEVEVKANKHKLLKEFVPKIYGVFKTKSDKILAYVTDEVKIFKKFEDFNLVLSSQFNLDTSEFNLIGDDDSELAFACIEAKGEICTDKIAVKKGLRFTTALLRACGAYAFNDIQVYQNWGTLNGKLVLLDYGYSENLWPMEKWAKIIGSQNSSRHSVKNPHCLNRSH